MKIRLKQRLVLSGLAVLILGNMHVVMAADTPSALAASDNLQLAQSSPVLLNQPHTRNGRGEPGGRPNGGGGGGRPTGGERDGGGPNDPPPNDPPPNDGGPAADIDSQLRQMIVERNLAQDPRVGRDLPNVDSPMVQLGKALFFANNLGGEGTASCASCHHPNLGGADDLALPVGVDAVDVFDKASPHLLGNGRFHDNDNGNRPIIGRNSPTVFNIGLFDRGLFWDSRVEVRRATIGSNGQDGRIITPDSEVNEQGRRLPDANIPRGTSLPAAQARFPVTSQSEMRGRFAPDADNQTLRAALNRRFDNSDVNYNSTWDELFGQAFVEGPDANGAEVSFDRIAHAIGEYERSMTFVENPWFAYVNGDVNALTEQQKQGALLFFTPRNQGGGGCAQCHQGSHFSDGRHHLTAFPQIGPGAGDTGVAGATDDFGREKVTGSESDRYHFRTPSLLNIAVSAPYGHSGAYQDLAQVVRHYVNPQANVDHLFGAVNGQPYSQGIIPLCQAPQVAGLMAKNALSCEQVYPNAYANSQAALQRLAQARAGQVEARAPFRGRARFDEQQVQAVVSFLHALTDPCVVNSECMQPWIIDEDDRATFPDSNPLIGINAQGDAL